MHILGAREKIWRQPVRDSKPEAAPLGGFGRLGTTALVFARALLRWYRRRQALAEIGSLDARTLKDTGLHRGEIWSIADAYARGEPYERPPRSGAGERPYEETRKRCRGRPGD